MASTLNFIHNLPGNGVLGPMTLSRGVVIAATAHHASESLVAHVVNGRMTPSQSVQKYMYI